MPSATARLQSVVAVIASTLAAGVLGLASNMLMASVFGRSLATDAFFMAQSVLRIFGKFFQGGPLRQIAMPIFMEKRQADADGAERYASNLISATACVFGVLAAGLWLAAPHVVAAIAPGFAGGQEALTVRLTRLFVPVILCTVLINLLTTFLHAFHRFGPSEWLARVPSAAMIAALLWGRGRWPIESLAWALLIGSALQTALLWDALRRQGFRYRPLLQLRQPELAATGRRLAPFFGSSMVVQLQLVVHRVVASTQPAGTLSSLSYADRITQFLDTVIGVVPLVLFPRFIEDALQADRTAFRRRLERVALLCSLGVFPMVVAVIVFSRPLIQLLLERGRFDQLATDQTALSLAWLSVGLLAWIIWGICKSAAYALQEPRIVNIAVIGISLTTSAITWGLGRAWGLAGLAISSALVPFLMSAAYFWLLRRSVPELYRIVWNGAFFRITVAAAGMAGACWWLRDQVWGSWFAGTGWPVRLGGLAALSGAGVLVYWLLLAVLRVEARQEFRSLLWRALRVSWQKPAATACT